MGERLMTCGGLIIEREAGGAGGQRLPGLGGEGDRTGALPALISPRGWAYLPRQSSLCPRALSLVGFPVSLYSQRQRLWVSLSWFLRPQVATLSSLARPLPAASKKESQDRKDSGKILFTTFPLAEAHSNALFPNWPLWASLPLSPPHSGDPSLLLGKG